MRRPHKQTHLPTQRPEQSFLRLCGNKQALVLEGSRLSIRDFHTNKTLRKFISTDEDEEPCFHDSDSFYLTTPQFSFEREPLKEYFGGYPRNSDGQFPFALAPDQSMILDGIEKNSPKPFLPQADNPKMGAELVFPVYQEKIVSILFSPDGRLVAVATNDTVEILDAKTAKRIHTIKADVSETGEMTFSPDSKFIALPSRNRLTIYDVATGKVHKRFEKYSVTTCSSEDNDSNGDDTTKEWDSKMGECLRSFTSYNKAVKAFFRLYPFHVETGREKATPFFHVSHSATGVQHCCSSDATLFSYQTDLFFPVDSFFLSRNSPCL
jgi:WD40 repeat protein